MKNPYNSNNRNTIIITNKLIISLTISVTAEKEGFVIKGPDAKGVFFAHKLAEIIVHVSDHADGSSLQVPLPTLYGINE